MTKVSKSPERNTFQRDAYIKRCEEEGKEPNPDYLELYNSTIDQNHSKFDDAEARKNSLEYDLLTTDWILDKVRNSNTYAQNLYAAICNNSFTKNDVWPILKNQTCGYSWRYAGGIIADMQQKGDYIDWYCSGIRGGDEPDVYNQAFTNGYVSESVVTEEIRADLFKLGWLVVEDTEE